MNIRIVLITVAAAFSVSGCDLYGYGLVFKSTLDKAVLEKKGVEDNLKAANLVKEAAEKELKNLKDKPQKPEEILVPPSAASCKPLIDTAVANKICQAPARKVIAKNNQPKPAYINKAASGGKKLPDIPASAKKSPAVGGGITKPYTPWGFVQHDATDANPKKCFVSDPITGSDSRCTSLEIVRRAGNETQSQWLARIASDQLNMKGFKTEILGKSH